MQDKQFDKKHLKNSSKVVKYSILVSTFFLLSLLPFFFSFNQINKVLISYLNYKIAFSHEFVIESAE